MQFKLLHSKNLLILFIALFVLAVILQMIPRSQPKSQPSLSEPKAVTPSVTITKSQPKRVTMEGEIVCLPHRNTSGPQTMECAFGIKTDEGEYYAFDTGLMSSMPTQYTSGRIRANGILTPIEELSTDQWQKYNIKGIFSATDSLEKVK